MNVAEALGAIASGLMLASCRGPTCPAIEPSGRRYAVREVIADAAALEGHDVTVCGFVWVEYQDGALWQDADAFERLRGCIASPAECAARKDRVRLTLGGNLEKWRGFHGEDACVRGVLRRATVVTSPDVSPLEIAAKCAESP